MELSAAILVLVDRGGGAQAALQKASALARYLGAVIELFSCDTEHASAVRRAPNDASAQRVIEECFDDSERYLDALSGSVVARDLDFRHCVACAASVAEGLAARVEALAPLLVIRGIADGGERGSRLSLRPEVVQLVKQVTAPILLTRGSPWAPSPRIVIADEFSSPDAGTRAQMLNLANRLRAECHGWFAEPTQNSQRDPHELGQSVENSRADILVVAAPDAEGAAPSSRACEFEALLASITCDTLIVPRIVPRSPVTSSAVARLLVAFRANPAHRQPRKPT
ncbi:MAG: hypothetical protein RL412_1002 [Pseudomonadota bacterium]|jgi:hypothetical protein